MRLATVLGANGGLSRALIAHLIKKHWKVHAVCRLETVEDFKGYFQKNINDGQITWTTVNYRYSEHKFLENPAAIFITQGIFANKSLLDTSFNMIDQQLEVGLTEPIKIIKNLLASRFSDTKKYQNICVIGSTSAYNGFKNTSVYCSVKHGLLGFVRAMNDEYAETNTRFFIASMGTMDTEMGRKILDQDPDTFLQPNEVAARIVQAVTSDNNCFEPEILIRRRYVRYK